MKDTKDLQTNSVRYVIDIIAPTTRYILNLAPKNGQFPIEMEIAKATSLYT